MSIWDTSGSSTPWNASTGPGTGPSGRWVAHRQVAADQGERGRQPVRVLEQHRRQAAEIEYRLLQLGVRGVVRGDQAVAQMRCLARADHEEPGPGQPAARQPPCEVVRDERAHAVSIADEGLVQDVPEMQLEFVDKRGHVLREFVADPAFAPGQLHREHVDVVAEHAAPAGEHRRGASGVREAEQP